MAAVAARTRLTVVAAAVAVVAVAALALWWWNPFSDDYPDVPDCAAVAAKLPSAAGGRWAVSKQYSARQASRSSSSCELAFTSADQRTSGTVTVLLIGHADTGDLRTEVAGAPCDGAATPSGDLSRYLAFRACTEVIGDTIRATVVAAENPRWVRTVVTTTDPPGDGDATVQATQKLARTIADQALSISA